MFDYAEEKDFDILLLDIEMPGINGIELAKTVRKDNSTVQIIFVTGYYDYFSDGFDVSALHYLIKPVNERKLCPVLDKAADNLSYRQRSVLITTADADIKVSLADITYVESENVHIIVHTVNGNYRTRISLAKFAEQLDDNIHTAGGTAGAEDNTKSQRQKCTACHRTQYDIIGQRQIRLGVFCNYVNHDR